MGTRNDISRAAQAEEENEDRFLHFQISPYLQLLGSSRSSACVAYVSNIIHSVSEALARLMLLSSLSCLGLYFYLPDQCLTNKYYSLCRHRVKKAALNFNRAAAHLGNLLRRQESTRQKVDLKHYKSEILHQ